MTHTAINVKDMEETLSFYREALGFQKIFELPDPETKEPWIVYIQVCKGQFLELFYTKPGAEFLPEPEIGLNHICFCVENVEETAKRIEQAGYELFIRPCVGCDHNKQVWVKDPNGVRIELMEISEASPHFKYM